jgi:hypothetical protein
MTEQQEQTEQQESRGFKVCQERTEQQEQQE